MALPVSFRWDEEFVARVDEARGLVPRSAFVRAAVEQALSEAKEPSAKEQADPGSVSSSEGVRSAAPAEQPDEDFAHLVNVPVLQARARAEGVRSSSLAKRDVRPVPKKGEK